MFPKALRPIAASSTSAHFADQMLLAGLPLLLTAAGHSTSAVSLVVTAQAAAWLLVSLPAGAFADQVSRRAIMQWGATAACLGAMSGAAASIFASAHPAALALAAFVTGAGVVMIVLSIFALLPRSVERDQLARSNAVLELGRACTAIVAPSVAAYLVTRGAPLAIFGLALGGGLMALIMARAIPVEPPRAPSGLTLARSIGEGAAFVTRQPLPRAIALCAIFWNSAFFGLTAVFVPYAVKQLGLSILEVGRAWSVYGAGLLLGAILAPAMIARLPTGAMFCFGPALSAAGALVMVLWAPTLGIWPVWLAFFCIGFGPMTWLVLQTSVRQIVTPPDKLGRVGATITTAIYGVRPLGAMAAGATAHWLGVGAALWLATVLFVLSALSIVLSPAARLRAMPVRHGAATS